MHKDTPVSGGRHVVVWLDHVKATIINLTGDESHEHTVRSQLAHSRAHSDRDQSGGGHVRDDVEFFEAIARLVGDVPEVLVVGPGLAKTAFQQFVRTHHPSLAGHIVGVETVDHPTSGQLLKYGKQYFQRVDQLLGDQR